MAIFTGLLGLIIIKEVINLHSFSKVKAALTHFDLQFARSERIEKKGVLRPFSFL